MTEAADVLVYTSREVFHVTSFRLFLRLLKTPHHMSFKERNLKTHSEGLTVSYDEVLRSVIHWTGACGTQTSDRSHVNHCTAFSSLMLPHVLQG